MADKGSSPKDQRRLYRDLVWMWPIISPPRDYVDEGGKISRLIKERSPHEVRTLLHLGCGAGHNDYSFKDHFEVTGIDISGDMLDLARSLNPEVDYHEGDMRTVRLGKTFDTVAALDSLAYMLSEDDLRRAFDTAFVHLKPGGVFLALPESSRESFEQNRTYCSSHSWENMIITFVENYYDPDPSDTTFEATFVYLIRKAGRLEIETDHHLCGIFDMETWERLLMESGFDVESTSLRLGDDGGTEEDYPLFLGIKPGH
jgi:SAM-dependent methyltransferase